MDSSVTINLLIRTLGRRERSVFVGRATLDTNTWPRPHACNRSARPDYRRSRSTTSFPSIPPLTILFVFATNNATGVNRFSSVIELFVTVF